MNSEPDARIVDLQTHLAHQARTIEELSEVVRRQGDTIDRLERTLREMAERLISVEDTAAPRPEITRPPHY